MSRLFPAARCPDAECYSTVMVPFVIGFQGLDRAGRQFIPKRDDECVIVSGERQRESSRIIAAPFSAIIAVGVLVLPDVMVGITEASITRNPAIP
jgi:hypothetical protein